MLSLLHLQEKFVNFRIFIVIKLKMEGFHPFIDRLFLFLKYFSQHLPNYF